MNNAKIQLKTRVVWESLEADYPFSFLKLFANTLYVGVFMSKAMYVSLPSRLRDLLLTCIQDFHHRYELNAERVRDVYI